MSTTQNSCECGCGRAVRGRFVSGHNRRRAVTYEVTSSGCWQWLLKLDDQGYGVLQRDGRNLRAHRLFYEQAFGPIPAGLTIDHLCRNRGCVNPAHLEAVTRVENARRGSATLTAADVERIRTQGEPAEDLAAELGVSVGHIHNLRSGRNWGGNGRVTPAAVTVELPRGVVHTRPVDEVVRELLEESMWPTRPVDRSFPPIPVTPEEDEAWGLWR